LVLCSSGERRLFDIGRDARDLLSKGHDYQRQGRLVILALSRKYVQGLLLLFLRKGDQWTAGVVVDVYNELKRAILEIST